MSEGHKYDQTTYDDQPDKPEDDLHELPPSAKLVYKILEYEDELTQTQLAEESRLPVRTVREGLRRLEAIDAVDSRTNLKDARQSFYSAAEVTADAA